MSATTPDDETKHRHECPDWDFLTIEMGDVEFESCACFDHISVAPDRCEDCDGIVYSFHEGVAIMCGNYGRGCNFRLMSG